MDCETADAMLLEVPLEREGEFLLAQRQVDERTNLRVAGSPPEVVLRQMDKEMQLGALAYDGVPGEEPFRSFRRAAARVKVQWMRACRLLRSCSQAPTSCASNAWLSSRRSRH